MSGYVPVFSTIYHGTLCGKWPAAPVWASLLPLADKHGEIDMTHEAIAGFTGWPIELLRQGIAQLCEPDPVSRSPDHDGRRLILIDPEHRDWGWRVVNHSKYREKARLLGRDAQRVKSGENRERMANRQTPADPRSTPLNPPHTHTHTQTKKLEPRKRGDKTSLPADFSLTEEREGYAREQGIADPSEQLERFRLHHGASGSRFKDWDLAWMKWCRNSKDFARGKQSGKGQQGAYHRILEANGVIEGSARRLK